MVSLRSGVTAGEEAASAQSNGRTGRRRAKAAQETPSVQTLRRSRRLHPSLDLDTAQSGPVPGPDLSPSPSPKRIAEDLNHRLALDAEEQTTGPSQPAQESSLPGEAGQEDSGGEAALSGSSIEEGVAAGDGRSSGSESDESSEDELQTAGDGLLQAFATSMFAALGGGGKQSTDQQVQPQLSAQPVDAADSDIEEMHWQPETELPDALDADAAAEAVAGIGKEPGLAKQLMAPPRDRRQLGKAARQARPSTAGRGWFDLPETPITDEVKQDLRLLRLRGAMDPKRFYKSYDNTKFPKYFQMGTLVEGPADFYSGRLTRRERKATLTEELLADPELGHSRKKRYGRLQEQAQKWSHKKVKRKTSNPRRTAKPRRPKH